MTVRIVGEISCPIPDNWSDDEVLLFARILNKRRTIPGTSSDDRLLTIQDIKTPGGYVETVVTLDER